MLGVASAAEGDRFNRCNSASQEHNMTLEQIFYLSQSVASVAVVGSLIYLGLQVRSAERSQRAIMQQGRADRAANAALAIASPQLARVFQKGAAGDSPLTREEFTQWMMVCRALFPSGEDSFLQYKAGQLDRRAFDSYVAGARFWMASAGMRAAWKLSAGQFGSEFRDFGNSLLAQVPTAQGADAYSEWQRNLKSESPAAGV
jgi:hypothetical protein